MTTSKQTFFPPGSKEEATEIAFLRKLVAERTHDDGTMWAMLDTARVATALKWYDFHRNRAGLLRAEVGVTDGTLCAEAQADGKGACGSCLVCLRATIAALHVRLGNAVVVASEAIEYMQDLDEPNGAPALRRRLVDIAGLTVPLPDSMR